MHAGRCDCRPSVAGRLRSNAPQAAVSGGRNAPALCGPAEPPARGSIPAPVKIVPGAWNRMAPAARAVPSAGLATASPSLHKAAVSGGRNAAGRQARARNPAPVKLVPGDWKTHERRDLLPGSRCVGGTRGGYRRGLSQPAHGRDGGNPQRRSTPGGACGNWGAHYCRRTALPLLGPELLRFAREGPAAGSRTVCAGGRLVATSGRCVF